MREGWAGRERKEIDSRIFDDVVTILIQRVLFISLCFRVISSDHVNIDQKIKFLFEVHVFLCISIKFISILGQFFGSCQNKGF